MNKQPSCLSKYKKKLKMKTTKNTHLDLKLHEMNNIKLKEVHTNELGMKVPDDYFSNSKIQILNRIKEESQPKVVPYYKKKQNWMAAASLLILLGLSFYSVNGFFDLKKEPLQTSSPVVIENNVSKKVLSTEVNLPEAPVKRIVVENKIVEKPSVKIIEEEITLDQIKNNLLVESLFLEENQLNEYVTNYMLEDI